MFLRDYRLKDGSIYWHKLYFSLVPKWMVTYAPPLGGYNYAAYLYQPQQYIQDLWNEAKWFVQRGWRGYSDRDAWDLSCYLAQWMPGALTQLKKNRQGHPLGLSGSLWDAKIDRMINAFITAQKIQGWNYKTVAEAQAALKQFRKDFNVFKINFFRLWD